MEFLFNDMKPLLLRNIKRLFIIGVFCSFLLLLAVIIIVLLAVLTPILRYCSLFRYCLHLPYLLPLMAPIYLFEEISLMEAFRKTFRLGFATWGGVFLILIVMGLIASVLQGIVSIPWYIIYIVKMVFTMSDGGEAGGFCRTELCTISVLCPDVVWLLLVSHVYGCRSGLSVRSRI